MPSGSAGGSSTTTITPTYRYDVSRWGAVPGDTTGLTDLALETIRKDIIDTRQNLVGDTNQTEIYFPSNDLPWYVRFPFCVDLPDVVIRGAGRKATVLQSSKGSFPPLVLGMSRAPAAGVGPTDLAPINFPDLYGKLESAAVSSTGKRYGIYLYNDPAFVSPKGFSHVAFPFGSSFSIGKADRWATMQKFTLDICLDGMGAAHQAGCICGMADNQSVSPWYFRIVGTTFELRFATSACSTLANQYYYVTFAVDPTWTHITRITVQADLTLAAPVSAWVGHTADGATATAKLKVLVSAISSSGGPPTYAAGGTFAENAFYPFQIGIASSNTHASTDIFSETPRAIYGLSMDSDLLYDNAGSVGSNQARLDGFSPITDLKTYFTAKSSTIGLLDSSVNTTSANLDPRLKTNYPTTNPASPSTTTVNPCRMSGRLVPYLHGLASGSSSYGYGWFFGDKSQGGGNSMIANPHVRDITIKTGDQVEQAVAFGAVLQPVIENVWAVGGWHGFGWLGMGVNWLTRIKNCEAWGYDAHVFCFMGEITIDGFRSSAIAKEANFRFVGCNGIVKDVSLQGNGGGKYGMVVHGKNQGGTLTVKYWKHDNEGGIYPLTAMFYYENNGSSNPPYLKIEDVEIGSMNPGASVVLIHAAPRVGVVYRPLKVDLGGLCFGDSQAMAVVQVLGDGTMIDGTVDHVTEYDDIPPIVCNTTTGTSGLQSIHREFLGPPTTNFWNAGSHHIIITNPVEGQFAEIRCGTSGQYGTATPPVWIGLNALDYADGSGIAAYVLPEDYTSTPVLN